MIYNLTDNFLKNVYPQIGKENVWETYNEFYYKPNKEILNLHFNRWNEFDKQKLKNQVNKWSKNEFDNKNIIVIAFEVVSQTIFNFANSVVRDSYFICVVT